jgi:hypothetical protein
LTLLMAMSTYLYKGIRPARFIIQRQRHCEELFNDEAPDSYRDLYLAKEIRV